ncbi:MAG: URC4/urg3 family protein [bacterium]|nr:URC4/urg3 family protein [bacterium]
MNKQENQTTVVLLTLNNSRTIRERAHQILQLAKENKSEHFTFNSKQMEPTAAFIMEVINDQYPKLDIPYHSRWRHFEVGHINRVKEMLSHLNLSSEERGKILYELIIISVFLDAGAGTLWRYKEIKTNREYSRSEGLALASLALYQQGAFSACPEDPFRVDAQRLIEFTADDLNMGFQVSAANPLEGVTGRIALLNKLGTIIAQNPQFFGDAQRLGDFYVYISSLQTHETLSAELLFQSVLKAFNSIWPQRLAYQGVSLGDVWIHKALKTKIPGSEYMPFHKLSQWLTYSLIEPLEQAGIQVSDLDQLTGLPEYRNGGLLIDMNLLILKNKSVLLHPQEPGSEIIVEWRALTVALLDELAVLIRTKLHKDSHSLPLAKILQGGTWEAGRRIAKQKRENGTPPIQIISDGTVF